MPARADRGSQASRPRSHGKTRGPWRSPSCTAWSAAWPNCFGSIGWTPPPRRRDPRASPPAGRSQPPGRPSPLFLVRPGAYRHLGKVPEPTVGELQQCLAAGQSAIQTLLLNQTKSGKRIGMRPLVAAGKDCDMATTPPADKNTMALPVRTNGTLVLPGGEAQFCTVPTSRASPRVNSV
jgi:hypothetical protein